MRRFRENSTTDKYVDVLVKGGYTRQRAKEIVADGNYEVINATSSEELGQEICFRDDGIDDRSVCFAYVDFKAIGDAYIQDGIAFKVDGNTYIDVFDY